MSDLCKCGHAKDHHFTPRLGGRCFRHECECVAFETPAADCDDLAAILAKHRENKTEATHNGCRCECGEPICTGRGAMSHDWHYRAHVDAEDGGR